MKTIVPAILTDNRGELIKMLKTCAEFADYVQIDIMDGEFVPSKSVTLADLEGLKTPLKSEAHLMVRDPLPWLPIFKKIGSERVIFHFEIEQDFLKIIEKIRKEEFEVGIAVNPSTEIDDFKFLIDKIDTILFLSVNPGFYGAPFIPGVLEKIKRFKKIYPHKLTGVDGGVKLDNLKEVKMSGVDYICVGSAILKNKNPNQAYSNFKELS
ncbi:MAG: ribulose-phosphate 3-epimerase [Candidatus Omnitrophica bacterium]|nr:ribulose-phosphate 3-epimerase [Candidatus Omnitrophota bacterium]MBU1523685.1 ribulose-phosphate 3-epimerase [Candidatus Omnitrophota bacterium]MBU2437375.1 ribulose-phosphate 3-epimerase [Candidatus Omnitrophota bacterium]